MKCFTAFWPDESGERHRKYVHALGASSLVTTIAGTFKRKSLMCGVTSCTQSGRRVYRSFEVKETDVNIALAMLDDAYRGLCDIMVLVTGDSDLIPAVGLIKERFPSIRFVLYVPGPHQRYLGATSIRSVCDEDRSFPAAMLPKFQLPDPVVVRGQQIHKPEHW